MTTHATAIPEVLDPTTDAGRRAASRRWWFLAAVFVIAPIGLLVMAVLAVVVWFYGQHAAALAKVREEVARIQAAGEPITTDDLYARSRVPAGTNDITPLWLAALGSIDETKFNADAKPLPIVGEVDGSALSAGDVAMAEQLLAKYDSTVQATLKAAAAEGECRFHVEFTDGFSALLPNAQKMRTLGRMMAVRTRLAAAQGNTEQAVESVEAMFEASRTLAQQQLLIEHLVRLAIASTALRETEFLLNEMSLTDEQLARLRAKVEALDFQQSLVSSCIGERCMGYYMFSHPEQFDMNAGDFTKKASTGPGNITRGADCVLYLELQRDVVAAAREPFPGAIDKADLVEQRLKSVAGTKNPLDKFSHMFTLLMMPSMSASFQATSRNLAHRDLILVAIVSRQYEHKNGELPASLTVLVPEFLPAVPSDPFDGNPMRFKAMPAGLMLYSIGRDRKDDGGTDPEQKSEPDIVVLVKKG